METINIEKIKDRVYELEGLLELAKFREDKLSELLPLIKQHAEEIHDMLKDAELSGESEEKEQTPGGVYMLPENETVSSPEITAEMSVADEKGGTAVGLEVQPDASLTRNLNSGKPENQGGKPAFCINDRFRFRRGLFNNSDSEFTSAMDLVATMDSYEEAEEYFLGDLGWDQESPDVADFLEIIRIYFERR